ncbi:MAG TPA: hypothetical protein VF038_13420 [Usitatibacter sp.]|jgi:hypothetical protein
MTRSLSHRIVFVSAASLLALAAFAAVPRDAEPRRAASAPAALSLLDTLILLRWGQGALDWTLPDVKGERDVPHRDPRA